MPRPFTIALALLGSLACFDAAADTAVRRFALLAGNDFGGEGTKPLLYAKEDARKLHDILLQYGGVDAVDLSLLLDADAQDFLTALGELERRSADARRQGQKTQLFVYYSGHAKDGALRLGKSKLSFEAIKGRLAQAPADVRIAIFDACRSGSMTRTKGARKAPAFEVESDATRAAKGLVILTSSASDEDSQESDQLGGSYFSHHLASALRGSADRSGDGRTSLAEAYAYAYDLTVADTADSAAGPQHPTFSFDLAGNGDVVLTDFSQRREGLVLPAAAPPGPYFVIDPRGFVVAEVQKAAGAERRIALAPGDYHLKRRLADRLRVGRFSVVGGKVTTLDERLLRDVPFADDPLKGPGRSELYARHFSFGLGGAFQAIFDAPASRGGLFPSTALLGVELISHNFFGRGFSLAGDVLVGGTRANLSLPTVGTLGFRYSELAVGSTLLIEWPEGPLVPFVGPRIGLMLATRTFDAEANLPTQLFYSLTPGVVGGLRWKIAAGWNLSARARLHYLLYNIEEPPKNFGYLEAGLMLGYAL